MRSSDGVRRLVRLVAVLALLALGPLACSGQDPDGVLSRLDFHFTLPDLDGATVSMGDPRFENKVVLVDVWGTWCPPCREMTPFLNELHSRYADQGLEIVGVAFEYPTEDGSDPIDVVRDYVSSRQVEHLTLYAGAAEYASSIVFDALPFREFDGFPTVVILGRDGQAKAVIQGWDEEVAERIESVVRELIDTA